jgi:glycosyltransferase involved in cell wall biosynthesis
MPRLSCGPDCAVTAIPDPVAAPQHPTPLVSVVIPAYNAERTIPSTLASVLSQTLGDLEVIVVDDGSIDNTAKVASSLGDDRVRVIRQDNTGHAGARNTGTAAAKGKYVAVVDADDLWLPHKLERQFAILRAAPAIRALHASAVHVDDSLDPLFIGPCPNGRNVLLDVLCFRGLPGIMCTLIVERALLDQVGGFDPSLIILQDWDLAIKLARRQELYSTSEPLALYRVHEGNQSKDLDLHIEPGERLLAEFFADPGVPPDVARRRQYVYAHFYAMLCGGAFQLHRYPDAAFWARRAVSSDPRVARYLGALPVRRWQKRRTRRLASRFLQTGGQPRPA